jgi:hypothetical protein
MTISPATKAARRVLREWCTANGTVLEPVSAADLVKRIAAAIEGGE